MMRSFGAPALAQKAAASVSVGKRGAGNFRAAENGEVKLFERDREPVGRSDQFHRVGDGLFLEIIAKGKIAEHFEKGVVAIGEADIFEVVVFAAGADAFLASGGAVVVALLEAEEDVLELVHAGIGEEQSGIVGGDERRAAHDFVAALFEEAQKHFARFVAGEGVGHMSLSWSQPLSQRLATEARRHRDLGEREARRQGSAENATFVSIRKLEVSEMARVIRSFNRGVSIRIWLNGIALKCRTNPSCLRARNR